jgi:hypothetical protein
VEEFIVSPCILVEYIVYFLSCRNTKKLKEANRQGRKEKACKRK